MENPRFRCVFLDNYYLLINKKYPYLYKTTSKEFEFLHKSYATAVAIATMAFQDGGYFGLSSNIEADRAGFLWWSVVECGGVWWSVVECGGVWWSEEE